MSLPNSMGRLLEFRVKQQVALPLRFADGVAGRPGVTGASRLVAMA
ncbi:hypothetical protein ACFFOP_30390 [Sinosporangium siamense]